MPRIKGSHSGAVRIRINEVASIILENPRFFQSKSNTELRDIVRETYKVKARMANEYILAAKE